MSAKRLSNRISRIEDPQESEAPVSEAFVEEIVAPEPAPEHPKPPVPPLSILKLHVLEKTGIVQTPFGNVVAPAGTMVVSNEPYNIPLDANTAAILESFLKSVQ